jgi:fructuronate reductase
VADAMADPALAAYVAALMAEAATTLRQPQGADLPGYQLSLQQRFRNPALRHRTAQIAMDGSQKLPQRLLGTVRDRLGQGRPIPCLALAVAAWMGFVARRDTAGRLVPLQDPMADRLMALAGDAGPVASRLAPALLGVSEIFGTDLAADPRFTRPVTEALGVLLEAGVHSALQAVP